jgi:hypothetical protein
MDSIIRLPVKQYLSPQGGKKALLHIQSVSGSEIRFEIEQKQKGETALVLTNPEGHIITTKNFAVTNAGKWENSVSTAGLPAGIYYLAALLDKRLEHIQEVIIK